MVSKDLIETLAPADQDDYVSNLMEFVNIVYLTIDQSANELVIIRHLSKAVNSLKKAEKLEKVVNLCEMGSVAQIIRFKLVEVTFD